MSIRRDPVTVRLGTVLLATLAVSVLSASRVPTSPQGQADTYTVYTDAGRRTLPYLTAGNTETVSLDHLASLFQFTVAEELLVEDVVGGLTLTTPGERILLIPGQSWAQVGGDVRSLSGAVDGERGSWRVPIDFISRALGPALGTSIDVRRGSRLIVVGSIRVPSLSGRLNQQGRAGELVLNIQPGTRHTVSRDGGRLTIRFDAQALDLGDITGSAPDYVLATRANGNVLEVDLGPLAATHRADTDRNDSRLRVDLRAPVEPPRTSPSRGRSGRGGRGLRGRGRGADPPIVDTTPPGVIETIVIDPGHGGSDAGARGPGGLREKDITWRMAQQLKRAIENQLGLRVVLTRSGDEAVSLDQRSALANNNKADLFVSLHANAAIYRSLQGAQVVSLSRSDYQARGPAVTLSGGSVPVLGGGSRVIEAVPWDLAQLPHADRSAALGSLLVRRLSERGVPLFTPEAEQRPLRVLVGTNMPAVLIELGFLSNPDDARALESGDRLATIADVIVAAITEIRRGIPPNGAGDGGRP